MILGLDNPTSGSALVNGRPFADHRQPLFEVGALLDPKAFHPGRSAVNHLRCLALANGIDQRRVDDVLDLVGLTSVAAKRAGGFSLGMGQRLGIASALLGDPAILILDEPVNGLDPDGILWIRTLLRSLAAEGRTVLVSSHLMSEMALTAEHLIVIGQGRLLADDSVEAVVAASGQNSVHVRSPQSELLATLLSARGADRHRYRHRGNSPSPARPPMPSATSPPPTASPSTNCPSSWYRSRRPSWNSPTTASNTAPTATLRRHPKKAQPDHDRHHRRPTAPDRPPAATRSWRTCCARSGPNWAASAPPTGSSPSPSSP